MNTATTQQRVQTWRLAYTQADRQTRVPLRPEPDGEPVKVRPKQGQRREAGVVPRVDFGKHRDLHRWRHERRGRERTQPELCGAGSPLNRARRGLHVRAPHNEALNMSRR